MLLEFPVSPSKQTQISWLYQAIVNALSGPHECIKNGHYNPRLTNLSFPEKEEAILKTLQALLKDPRPELDRKVVSSNLISQQKQKCCSNFYDLICSAWFKCPSIRYKNRLFENC